MNATSSTKPATCRAAAAALAAVSLTAAVVGCGSSGGSSGSAQPAASSTAHGFPDTAVGRQASWLVGAAAQPPWPPTAKA